MTTYCEACEMYLPTNRDAAYHQTECHAFADQVREETRQELINRVGMLAVHEAIDRTRELMARELSSAERADRESSAERAAPPPRK